MKTPSIVILKRDDIHTRYHISGGEIAPEWTERLRPGEEPLCEFTLWGNDDRLSSYGGSVWPLAWPTLFAPVPASVSCGSAGIVLTAAGRAAVNAATTRDAALSALEAYVNAAQNLAAEWEHLGPFSLLDETVPEGFVDFDDQVHDLIEWLARARNSATSGLR